MSLHSLTQSRRASHSESEPLAIVFPICTNPLLHLGLEKILSDGGFAVWHDTIDRPSSLPQIQDEAPILFIIDGNSYADGMLDLIETLKAHSPTARIVILADRFNRDAVSAAWEAGAHGFCLSTCRHDILVKSLELVMLGETVLPSAFVFTMAEELSHHAEHSSSEGLQGAESADPKSRKLSNREAEILTCLKEGAPNKVIARKLNLSEATVKVHVKAILKKVGACNRTQAALWATRQMSADVEPV